MLLDFGFFVMFAAEGGILAEITPALQAGTDSDTGQWTQYRIQIRLLESPQFALDDPALSVGNDSIG